HCLTKSAIVELKCNGPATMPCRLTAAVLPKADGHRTLRVSVQWVRSPFPSPCPQRNRIRDSCDFPDRAVQPSPSIVSHKKRSTWFRPCESRAPQVRRSQCHRAARDTARVTTFFRDKGGAIFQNPSPAPVLR